MTKRETKANTISVITQAFYGNRTGTEIRRENIDRFVLGCLDDFPIDYPIDRAVIHLPCSDKLVLIYNKHKEEERRELKERVWAEEQYEIKPLANIPEIGLTLYSRCIVCRMDENGILQSLEEDDYKQFIHYLSM